MIKDAIDVDLEKALSFQKSYAEVVCKCLEARFSNNDIVLAFKSLNSFNVPSKMVDLNF